MMYIELTRGYKAMIDDEDYEEISKFNWHAVPDRHFSNLVYAKRSTTKSKNGKRTHIGIPLHRILLNAPKNMQVDHIDGNGLNCCRYNLRLCTAQQNVANQRKLTTGTSIYKGVSLKKGHVSKPWVAQGYSNGKKESIGYFATEKEAAVAYNNFVYAVNGEFARLNEV